MRGIRVRLRRGRKLVEIQKKMWWCAEAEKRQMSHQEEGSDGGDLVQLHQKSQSLLVVAAVLAVH